MAKEVFAQNLRRLRTLQGLSQEDVAEGAKISRLAYRNIESGEAEPRISTAESIARTLNVTLDRLFKESDTPKNIRFRAHKTLNCRETVITRVSERLKIYGELEQRLSITRDGVDLPRCDEAGSVDRAVRAAKAVREKFGLKDNDVIRDVYGLLEEKGIKVIAMPVHSEAFFGLSIAKESGGPAIAVNTWDRISVERWIFSAVHELGHLVLHLSGYNGKDELEDTQEEKEADTFASHFLMPRALFKKEWDETQGKHLYDRVLKVKRLFKVSYKTVLVRVSEDEEDKSVWGKFAGEFKRRNKRSIEKHEEPLRSAPTDFNGGLVERQVEVRKNMEPAQLISEDFLGDRIHRLVKRALETGVLGESKCAELLEISISDLRRLRDSWVKPTGAPPSCSND